MWATWAEREPELDRRKAERRTVTHTADGEVWAPVAKLAELLAVADDIDRYAEACAAAQKPYTARRFHRLATTLRIVIGAEVKPFEGVMK